MVTSIEQAEEMFGPFTNNQYIDILNYFMTGTVPEPDGCTSCDRHFVREVIGKIIAHNEEQAREYEENLRWEYEDNRDAEEREGW